MRGGEIRTQSVNETLSLPSKRKEIQSYPKDIFDLKIPLLEQYPAKILEYTFLGTFIRLYVLALSITGNLRTYLNIF